MLRKEKCTGDPVRRLGNDLVFQQLAEANLEALAQNKVKKIVSICPHCVRTIQEDWKEFGAPPAVEHHSEFLARYRSTAATGSRPGKESSSTIPATSAAIATSTTSRAQVAALAGELVEAPRSRERSFCCGAGGGLAFLGEEKGERVSHVRAAELAATGAANRRRRLPLLQYDVPGCVRSAGEGAPQLLDIAQLAARGLPE